MLVINHSVVPVRKDSMALAISFFKELGFSERKDRPKVEGSWGFAHFVTNTDWGDTLQLTEPVEQSPILRHADGKWEFDQMLPWVHVAFTCDVETYKTKITEWAVDPVRGLEVGFEYVPGGKLFVSLYQVLWIDLELVPAN